MRVLLVSDVTEPGGVDTYIGALASAGRSHGIDVEVLVDQSLPYGPREAALRGTGAMLHRGAIYHRRHTAAEQRKAMEYVLRWRRPDVVHVACGIPWSCLDAREAVLISGTPLVFTEQYVPSGLAMTADIRDRIAAIYQTASCIICVCQENREVLETEYCLPASGAIVIPNAVSIPSRLQTTPALPSSASPLQAITLARLVEQKGIDILLNALALLRAAAIDVDLAIYGDGPLRRVLECLARDLGVADQVGFHRWEPDARRQLRNFDVFVLPSRSEGQPFALLEAMAAGVPVIATAVSGIPEALDYGRCGTLVEVENPRALAHALAAFAHDPLQGRDIAHRAFRHVEKYHNIEQSIFRHIGLWTAASRPHQPAPRQI